MKLYFYSIVITLLFTSKLHCAETFAHGFEEISLHDTPRAPLPSHVPDIPPAPSYTVVKPSFEIPKYNLFANPAFRHAFDNIIAGASDIWRAGNSLNSHITSLVARSSTAYGDLLSPTFNEYLVQQLIRRFSTAQAVIDRPAALLALHTPYALDQYIPTILEADGTLKPNIHTSNGFHYLVNPKEFAVLPPAKRALISAERDLAARLIKRKFFFSNPRSANLYLEEALQNTPDPFLIESLMSAGAQPGPQDLALAMHWMNPQVIGQLLHRNGALAKTLNPSYLVPVLENTERDSIQLLGMLLENGTQLPDNALQMLDELEAGYQETPNIYTLKKDLITQVYQPKQSSSIVERIKGAF